MHRPMPTFATAAAPATGMDLGPMPEWNLTDLYASPKDAAVERDLLRCAEDARRIRTTYQGKLVGMGRDASVIVAAVRAYEDLSELMGKLASYAQLLYAGDQADPERAKFYGDVQERLTQISTDLVFFELELNQIADADLAEAVKAPALARYKPWLDDLRKEKPYQLDEKLETLFMEKGQTGRGAWTRLFSETMSALRFPVGQIEQIREVARDIDLSALSFHLRQTRNSCVDCLFERRQVDAGSSKQ